MSNSVRLLIACGSGIATSSVAAEEVKCICKDEGIDVEIFKSSMQEIESKQDSVDIVLCTNNYKGKLRKPYMSIFGLIAGINVPKLKKDLLGLIKEVQQEKKDKEAECR
ncbi:MAG: PTS sugar transporter subunit IIB [Anaerolineaceae bacterium]